MAEGDDDAVTGNGNENSGTGGREPAGQDSGNEPADDTELPAGHADDDADDGESGGGEDEVDAGAAAQPSRGANRIQRLANEAREAKEAAAAAQRQLDELRRAQWQRDQNLTAQQEAERLALMTPDEKATYYVQKHQRETDQKFQQLSMQVEIRADKSAYDAQAAINPVYARHKDEVERIFQDQLNKGQPTQRQVILENLLGKRALASAINGKRKATQDGQRRIDAQRSSGGNVKGDVAARRERAQGNSLAELEARLRDQFI